ncbi:hypothetical protein CI610_00062 [invertebrate metagenome]|uniref:Uncharacterized protein n=1 Tax=invertebrate metagenome TaxID=1711999 RepID=A0A2H9TCG6_9ZZZZ
MNNQLCIVDPAPKDAVTNGQCNFGTYNAPLSSVNLLDAKKPLFFPLPRWLKNFRLKEWEAIQIRYGDWFICLAVYNTKSVGTAIVMACDTSNKKMHVYRHKVPFWKLSVPKGLQDSCCFYKGNKKSSHQLSIEVNNQLGKDRVSVVFTLAGFDGLPDMHGEFSGHHSTEPLVIVHPFHDNRPLYSHKALMEAEGKLIVDGLDVATDDRKSSLILDDHKGFYPFSMAYDWVTAFGYPDTGALQGFNLTRNQVRNSKRYNENCLWLSGKVYRLPPVTISRPEGIESPWLIRDNHGCVDLVFTPLANAVEYLNLGIVKVDYNGPTGVFSGTISHPDSGRVIFDGMVGMGERKRIRL